MSLIDETYFQFEPVFIPGLESSNGFSSKVGGDRYLALIRTIERFEPAYMEMLLGDYVANEYYADTENSKWEPLITVLRNEDKKISPIANFVYCEFRRENFIATGDNGDMLPKVDNMQVVPLEHKLINAWNDMVRQNEKVCKWILDNLIDTDTPIIDLENEIDITKWTTTYGLLTKENGFL